LSRRRLLLRCADRLSPILLLTSPTLLGGHTPPFFLLLFSL
jgi:hypothetical protein